jgi:hypothetical protein
VRIPLLGSAWMGSHPGLHRVSRSGGASGPAAAPPPGASAPAAARTSTPSAWLRSGELPGPAPPAAQGQPGNQAKRSTRRMVGRLSPEGPLSPAHPPIPAPGDPTLDYEGVRPSGPLPDLPRSRPITAQVTKLPSRFRVLDAQVPKAILKEYPDTSARLTSAPSLRTQTLTARPSVPRTPSALSLLRSTLAVCSLPRAR